MVGRCIAYRNSPFFGGHVTFPGCNHKESMSIFGDTQLLMSEISQSWPGHLFENWKITLQTPTKHRLNRLITVGMLWGRPIRTWGPRDFNLIGNPELANCNELLRVKGEGRHTRSPRVSNCPTVENSTYVTAVPHHCTPYNFVFTLFATMITTGCIRFETIASGSDGWVVFNCLWLESLGAPVIYRTSAPSATWMHELDVEMMDYTPRSLTQPLKNGAFGHYFPFGKVTFQGLG